MRSPILNGLSRGLLTKSCFLRIKDSITLTKKEISRFLGTLFLGARNEDKDQISFYTSTTLYTLTELAYHQQSEIVDHQFMHLPSPHQHTHTHLYSIVLSFLIKNSQLPISYPLLCLDQTLFRFLFSPQSPELWLVSSPGRELRCRVCPFQQLIPKSGDSADTFPVRWHLFMLFYSSPLACPSYP